MKKRIVKVLAAILALVLLVVAFSASAVATTDSCVHANREFKDQSAPTYKKYNDTHHKVIYAYRIYACKDCGSIVTDYDEEFSEKHSFSETYTVDGGHVGHSHIWDCLYRCVHCGYSYTIEKLILPCSGNGTNCPHP